MSNNQSTHNQSKWSRKDKISLAAIVVPSIISIVVLAIFVEQTNALKVQTNAQVNQTSILNAQFVEKDRPWIGPEGQLDFSTVMEYHYTNYGAIPNTDAIISTIYSQNQLNRSSFQVQPSNFAKIGAVIPNQHKVYEIDIPDDYFIEIKSGKAPLYLGILINYTYHQNKQGEYGEIYSYSVAQGKLLLMYNWVS